MSIDSTAIEIGIASVEQLLKEDAQLSPAMRSAIALLIATMKLLLAHLGLDSHNSSKPPASDPHRERRARVPSERKLGGQPNRPGATLVPIADPDEIKAIAIDRSERRLYVDVSAHSV